MGKKEKGKKEWNGKERKEGEKRKDGERMKGMRQKSKESLVRLKS